MTITAKSPSALRSSIAPIAWTTAIEAWIEAWAPLLALAVLFVFIVFDWFASRGIRLWFDELLELTVATAPSIKGVFGALSAGVDSNPPLSHFLTRVSVNILGMSDYAARLPALVGFVGMLGCVYFYVSRWLSRSYGLVCMLVLVCSPARAFAWNARPYGIELGLCGLALVLHQRIRANRSRRSSLVAFGVCTACLALTHYYAVLTIGGFLLAEAVRALRSRQWDRALLSACIIPPVAVLIGLQPIWRTQLHNLGHYWGRGNILSFRNGYEWLALDPLIFGVAALGLTVAVVVGSWRSFDPSGVPERREDSDPVSIGVGLLLLPIIGAFSTQFVTHAYSGRYFVAEIIGFAMCLCYLADRLASPRPGAILSLMVALMVSFGLAVVRESVHPAEMLREGPALSQISLPVLFDSPADYLQTANYFPELRDRLWVIADPSASYRFRKYDTDDIAILAIAAKGRAQATTLTGALARWHTFILIARPHDYLWALKCVIDAGAEVRVQHAFLASWPNHGDSDFAFEVTLTPESAARAIELSSGANGWLP